MPDDRGGVTQAYVLGAAQKSGVYWEINPADGGVISSTFIGHGMVRWGSAVNVSTENSVLVALDNSSHWTNTLTGVNGVQQSWNAGAWGAINIKTGKFLWQIPAYGQDLANPAFGGSAPGAVSYTNNLLFAGSSSGYLAAVDATTGKTCWTFSTGVPIVSAPAIFNDTVYWGTGYRSNAIGTPMIYAFAPKS